MDPLFRTKDYPQLHETEKRLREAKRLRNLAERATEQGTLLGHDLGTFEPEQGWHSAVTTCKRCDKLAAIDWTERPYLFGLVYQARCGELPKHPVRAREHQRAVIVLDCITVGEML